MIKKEKLAFLVLCHWRSRLSGCTDGKTKCVLKQYFSIQIRHFFLIMPVSQRRAILVQDSG